MVTGRNVGALDRRKAIVWVLLRVSRVLRRIRHLSEGMGGVGEGRVIRGFGTRFGFHSGGGRVNLRGDKLLLKLSFCSGSGSGDRVLPVQDRGDVHDPPSGAETSRAEELAGSGGCIARVTRKNSSCGRPAGYQHPAPEIEAGPGRRVDCKQTSGNRVNARILERVDKPRSTAGGCRRGRMEKAIERDSALFER